MIQCIASGYSVMLHSDVTSKASSSAFIKLSFGVNMLGRPLHAVGYGPYSG